MRIPLKALHPTLFCVLLVTAHANARAEGFFDVYGGSARSVSDVYVSETTSSGTTSASAQIDLSPSTEFGLRFGAWHPTYNWFGLGMDLGYFQADGPGVNIDALPFSILLALRAPLFPTAERPGGRLQPYAMAGVSLYMVDVTVQLEGMGGSAYRGYWPYPGGNYEDRVFGPYLAAGLAWQPAKKFAVFGEYRYTSFRVDFDTTNSFLWPTRNGRVDTTVKTDHILVGLSYRFGADAPAEEARR